MLRAMRRPAALVLIATLALAAALGAHWVWTATSVGAGYAAKVACSLVLNSGQPLGPILRDYVFDEVYPLGPFLEVSSDGSQVEARVLGWLRARALHRAGLGCTLVPLAGGAELAAPSTLAAERPRLDPAAPWPLGGAGPEAPPAPAVAAAIERAFREPQAGGSRRRQTTAVAVVHDGRLVAERYAPGYGPETPLLSWSMAKSVIATLIGIAAADGRLALDAPAPVPEWSAPGDPRHGITLDHLLHMSSGLRFDETYGATNDVSRMLFTAPDTGAFAARSPLAAEPGSVWAYSSGTANLLARVLRHAVGGDLSALVRFARERLFDPVGMASAFFEPDASGTFIGSSFAFATARDWARFGELHRRGGEWYGRRVLPEGWVAYATAPAPSAPPRCYGAHWWLNAKSDLRMCRRWRGVPGDAYAARGHSGQYVVVVPSAHLVVVRLGLSIPDDGDDGGAELVAELVEALAPAPGSTQARRESRTSTGAATNTQSATLAPAAANAAR
jgi:hypothetical protein